MKRVCDDCGAEYGDHARYCNACGSERLSLVRTVGPTAAASVREDGQALWMASTLWLIGLGYLLTVRRPRDSWDLFTAWLFLTVTTFVLGLVLRSLRATMLFSLIAVPFLLLYWYIKLAS